MFGCGGFHKQGGPDKPINLSSVSATTSSRSHLHGGGVPPGLVGSE